MASIFAGCGQKQAVPQTPQGVVMIAVDALRCDHLNIYGYERETTPNVAALASKGVLFRDCIAQGTCPATSAASILTSLYPTSHAVQTAADRLPDEAETLAELYRKAGYATLTASALLADLNLNQGFETVLEMKSLDDLVQQARPWLETHKTGPFFAFLHIPGPLPSTDAAVPDADKQKQYDDAIQAVDSQLGRLLACLDELGLRDKTAIAFLGSFGYEFTNRTGGPSGSSVYGEVANVPLLLAGPGVVKTGRLVEDTVQTIDVMPTLLEMTGQPLPVAAQGASLSGFLKGDDSASFAFASRPAVIEGVRDLSPGGAGIPCAIVANGQKLVQRSKEGRAEFELFDHRKDPLDTANIAAQSADTIQKLKDELAGWRERANAVRIVPENSSPTAPPSEKLDQLKSLGYL